MQSNSSNRKPFSSRVYHTRRPMNFQNQQQRPMNFQNQQPKKNDMAPYIIRQMQEMKEDVLQQHKLKIEDLRDRYRSSRMKDSQCIDVLVDKEQELRRQQTQFSIQCDRLESRIENLISSHRLRDMAPIIRKEFEIECKRLRLGYPIYAHRLDIVESVKNSQVTILLGETGSGKSTQLVQYFNEAGLSKNGLIACTQPSKMAALNLAKFVSSELGTTFGQDVGFRAGYRKEFNKQTKMIFMSDYEMFCEFQKDKELGAYSCLIVDEVHERSIYSDLLLAMLKTCLSQRPELRVVVMSATIDPSIFQSYFPDSCLIKVPGRNFPVDIIWGNPTETRKSNQNYEDAAVKKAIEVHQTEKEGDILVFVATPKETENCSGRFSSSLSARNDYVCIPFHGRLDTDDQQKVFGPPPSGKRKIVFATNCAETSITIPNIKYVIDTGFAKELFFNEKSKMDILALRLISRSSADQRKGRAGRTSKGKCFRLYSEDDYINMRKSTEPEILRIHPAKAALKLFQMGADPTDFDFLEAPPASVLSETVDYLDSLGAISDKKITPLGNQISELPFDPQMSFFVIKAMQQEMTTEAVSIACLSSFSSNIFFRGRTDEEMESNRLKQMRFHDEYGDMISFLNVLQEYIDQNKNDKRRWCLSNAINEKTLRMVCDKMREVFLILKHKHKCHVNFPLKLTFSAGAIAKLFFTCFESNTCIYLGHPNAGYLALKHNKQVHIHPSSSIKICNLSPSIIIFQTLMNTSRDFAFTVLSVHESWLEVLNPSLRDKISEAESQIVKIVLDRGLGMQFRQCLVGPRYSDLNQLQKRIRQEVDDESVFLDVSSRMSKLTVYSKESVSANVKHLVEEEVLTLVDRQQEAVQMIKFDESNHSPKVFIKSGGCVKEVLMPSDVRTVIVKDVPEAAGINEVRDKLKTFGKIVNHQIFNSASNKSRWGSVTFESFDSARECISSTSLDNEIIAISCKSNSRNFSQCSAELTWTRRPLRGIGFVEFTDEDDYISMLRNLHHPSFRMRIDKKKPNSLFIPSIPKETNEEEIKNHFTKNFILNGDVRVYLPRIAKKETPNEENDVRRKLEIQLKKFFDSFTVKMQRIRPKDFFYQAWVEFPGNQIIPRESIYLMLDEEFVKFTPKFSSQIAITSKLYNILEDEIRENIETIEAEGRGSLEFKAKELKNGNFSLILNSDSAKKLNWAKKFVNDVIKGDVLEIGISQVISVLFSREGRTFFEELEKNIDGSSVFFNYHQMTLALHGTERVRTLLKLEMNNFIERMLTMKLKIINLNDNGFAKGLKRQLIMRYGEDLEKLKTELNLTQVELRRNTLNTRGSEESLLKLDRLLCEIPGFEPDEDEIDCSACFCPEKPESLYRIESCGHPYCKDCLKQMVNLALKEKTFPLVCSEEDCNMNMCWKDFNNFCKMSVMTPKKLVDSSLSHFVSINTEKLCYCITPDCGTVYQITTTGEPYTCYKCEATTCTTCKVDYHFGITCAMYESCKGGDQDIQKWMQEDVANRRCCPNCKNVIEKNGGCQHVACASCGMHICWRCMETFLSSGACYGHLAAKHSSFM